MTKIKNIWLLSIVLCLTCLKGWSQIVGSKAIPYLNFTLHDAPPKYLTSTRTAVLISVPMSDANPNIRTNWRKLAEEIHPRLRDMKIDAVAYFNIDDVFSGVGPAEVFSKNLTSREIKYILLVEQLRSTEENGSEDIFRFTVTPFNDKPTFISQNSNAWRVEDIGLKPALKKLFNGVYRAELKMENYLIPDIPELFDDVDIFQAKRIETYAMDLKVDKLYVPKFERLIIEDSSKMDEHTIKLIADFNHEIDQKNQKLEQIMSTYPLKYELVDAYTDDDIYSLGGQYALMRLEAPGSTIKGFLDYKKEVGENMYASIKAVDLGSTVRRLPVDAVVSKYYVKHVYTKDIYTGLKWDADLTWEEALKNFIYNMKDVLKVK